MQNFKGLIPKEVKRIAQAKKFLTALFDNNESYHPEDSAESITGNMFTSKECVKLNNLMEQINYVSNTEIAHTLWLTQNRHGSGFFDYSLDQDLEDRLTKAAQQLGEITLYKTRNKIAIM